MLGRERHRLAEAERERLVGARHPGPALGLVGDEDHRLAGAPHELGEGPVGRQQAGAGVDQEQDHVGLGDGRLGLRPHAAEKRTLVRLLEAGRVDDAEVKDRRAARRPRAGRG